MKPALAALLLGAASQAGADVVVPTRTIRAREIIATEDLLVDPAAISGAIDDPRLVVGQEARVALYPGRAIQPGDIGPPTLVERNDLVTLTFRRGGLHIIAEGRALGRGAAGESVRAMNLSSRNTITGQVRDDGSIEVR